MTRQAVKHLTLLAFSALLTAAQVRAAGEPGVATEALDIRTVQALNPLPPCMSSWPTMKGWLKHGFARAEDRVAPSASMAGGARWTRLDRTGQPVNAHDTKAEVACIRDTVTQLVWAVGLEGKAAIRRFPGGPVDISTESLIEQARAKQWCGKSDWKLPSRTQALSLVSFAHVRTDGEGSAWGQSGFPVAISVWTDSRSVRSNRPDEQWTVALPDGYTYLESTAFQPANEGQRHPALLVTSGSCTWFNRAFSK